MMNRRVMFNVSMKHAGRLRAFTLIEMLIALTLTAVLLTAVGNITLQVLHHRDVLETRRLESAHKLHPFARLADDVHAIPPVRGNFKAGMDTHRRPKIELIALGTVATNGDTLLQLPSRITYRLKRSAAHTEHLQLIRESEPLVGGRPAEPETIACGLRALSVELFIDDTWQPPPAGKRQSRQEPTGIRIGIEWLDGTRARRTFVLAPIQSRANRRAR